MQDILKFFCIVLQAYLTIMQLPAHCSFPYRCSSFLATLWPHLLLMSKQMVSLLLSDFTSSEPVSSNFLIIFTNRSPTSDHIFFMPYCRELFQTFCQVIASCKRRERTYSQTQYEANRVFIINAMFGTHDTFFVFHILTSNCCKILNY